MSRASGTVFNNSAAAAEKCNKKRDGFFEVVPSFTGFWPVMAFRSCGSVFIEVVPSFTGFLLVGLVTEFFYRFFFAVPFV